MSEQQFDRYGFPAGEPTDQEKHKIKEREDKDLSRKDKWDKMLKNLGKYQTDRHTKYHSRIKKGIPNSSRGHVWMRIIGIDPTKPIDEYDSLPSEFEDSFRIIDEDVPRTFFETKFYAKDNLKDNLKRVLKAFVATSKIQYIQGMSFIASVFLFHMNIDNAYSCFKMAMIENPWRFQDYFLNNFKRLNVLIKVWDSVLKDKFPEVKAILEKNQISHTLYTMTWFLTFFLTFSLPPEIRMNIFERFLVFGSRALISFGLVCIHSIEEQLKSKEFVTIVQVIQHPEEQMKDEKKLYELYDKHWLGQNYYRQVFKQYEPNEFF